MMIQLIAVNDAIPIPLQQVIHSFVQDDNTGFCFEQFHILRKSAKSAGDIFTLTTGTLPKMNNTFKQKGLSYGKHRPGVGRRNIARPRTVPEIIPGPGQDHDLAPQKK
jgi:hypothetical protein